MKYLGDDQKREKEKNKKITSILLKHNIEISLVFSFILATWVVAKIYPIDILIYGKKITLKELCRWLVYNG